MYKKIGVAEVIANNYCIGCGLCAYADPSTFAMNLNDYGQFEAMYTKPDFDRALVDEICPFSDFALNEDQLGVELFPHNQYLDTLGYISKSYAGFVIEGEYRRNGSSGGLGSWLANELLTRSLIDGVIHLKSSESEKLFFEYGISSNHNEIITNSKSRYYPVKLDDVLLYIKNHPGRYLFVGIPCMVKALRLLARKEKEINDSIAFVLGLVCGHIKSTAFAEMLGWQLGVKPAELKSIDFRAKLDGYGSNQYGVTVTSVKNRSIIRVTSQPVNEMFGTNWGLGYFKSTACDFCDDITAETADITIGDAWLPEYVGDSEGTNIIVVRNSFFNEMLQSAQKRGQIQIKELHPERIIESQSSGINHRRTGLQYRLHLNKKAGVVSPIKRVVASDKFDRKFRKIQELRIKLRDESSRQFLAAKKADDFLVFMRNMKSLNEKYASLYRMSLQKRVLNRIKKLFT